jgi:hypothetical protein
MEQPKISRWKLWLGGIVLAAAALFFAYTWLVLHWSYSSGERAGYVQKFSDKGWVCKTWEGELAMVSMPGTMSEKFNFTVRDEEVAAKINQSLGKKVTLMYKQHFGIPSSCFGDTNYYVSDIRVVE